MKNKKNKKAQNKGGHKKFSIFLYAVVVLIIFWLTAGIFLFFYKNQEPASIYVSTQNPKQGDTVFIRVKSEAPCVVPAMPPWTERGKHDEHADHGHGVPEARGSHQPPAPGPARGMRAVRPGGYAALRVRRAFGLP